MLRDSAGVPPPEHAVVRRRHDVYPRFLYNTLVAAFPCLVIGNGLVEPATIPYAVDVVPRDDLREPACLQMSDFDETRVEEKDVGIVKRDAVGCSFPLHGTGPATGLPFLVDVHTEF